MILDVAYCWWVGVAKWVLSPIVRRTSFITITITFYLILPSGLSLFAQQNGEFKQILVMADDKMNSGDYEDAKKKYLACQAVSNDKEEKLVAAKIEICRQIMEAQTQLRLAITQKQNIQPALDKLFGLQWQSPDDKYFQERIIVQIENEGDRLLKVGEIEPSADYFLLATGILKAKGIRRLPAITFKMERLNEQYKQKNNRELPQYAKYIELVRNENPDVPSLEKEYQKYWTSANSSFALGNYILAVTRYNLCLKQKGHENDKPAQDQLMAATKARDAQARGNKLMQQNKYGEAAQEYKTVLSLNAEDKITQQMAAEAHELYGDFLSANRFWTDARKNYNEALTLGSDADKNKILIEKIRIIDKKIKRDKDTTPKTPTIDSTKNDIPLTAKQRARLEKQRQQAELLAKRQQLRDAERAKRRAERLARRKPKKDDKPKYHFEVDPEKGKDINWAEVVAGEISVTGSYGLPILTNQMGAVKSRGTLARRWGGELVVLPNKTLSLVVGANYGKMQFNSMRANGAALEKFDIGLLQIPISLRFNKALSDDTQLHLQGGFTLNRVLNFNYGNYTKNINQTNSAIFNNNTLGFEVSVGYTTTFINKSRIGLMLTYNRTNNVLDTNYKDEATNRSSTSMALSGVGVKLILRLF